MWGYVSLEVSGWFHWKDDFGVCKTIGDSFKRKSFLGNLSSSSRTRCKSVIKMTNIYVHLISSFFFLVPSWRGYSSPTVSLRPFSLLPRVVSQKECNGQKYSLDVAESSFRTPFFALNWTPVLYRSINVISYLCIESVSAYLHLWPYFIYLL